MDDHDNSTGPGVAVCQSLPSLNAQRLLCIVDRPLKLEPCAEALPISYLESVELTPETVGAIPAALQSMLDTAVEEKGTAALRLWFCEATGEKFALFRTTPGPPEEQRKRRERLTAQTETLVQHGLQSTLPQSAE